MSVIDLAAARGNTLLNGLADDDLVELLSAATETARTLATHGCITYVRGTITILDRPRLQSQACACYQTIHDLTAQALTVTHPSTQTHDKPNASIQQPPTGGRKSAASRQHVNRRPAAADLTRRPGWTQPESRQHHGGETGAWTRRQRRRRALPGTARTWRKRSQDRGP